MPITVPELTKALAPYVGRTDVEMQRRQRCCREGGLFASGRHGRAAQLATGADAITLLLAVAATDEPIKAPDAVRDFEVLVVASIQSADGKFIAPAPAEPEVIDLIKTAQTLRAALEYALNSVQNPNQAWKIVEMTFNRPPLLPSAVVTFAKPIGQGSAFHDKNSEVRITYLPPNPVPQKTPAALITNTATVPGSVIAILADFLSGRDPMEDINA